MAKLPDFVAAITKGVAEYKAKNLDSDIFYGHNIHREVSREF